MLQHDSNRAKLQFLTTTGLLFISFARGPLVDFFLTKYLLLRYFSFKSLPVCPDDDVGTMGPGGVISQSKMVQLRVKYVSHATIAPKM